MFCGRRLHTLQNATLRPTQDRVREALFSSIADFLPGCAFLDLFAGTGSVGIEAWSRGAAHVCWVERDRKTFRILRENIHSLSEVSSDCKLASQCVAADTFLRQRRESAFDLVFADPPYARNRSVRLNLMEKIAQSGLLKVDGMLVLEQGADESIPVGSNDHWTLLRERRYGSSQLRFFKARGEK